MNCLDCVVNFVLAFAIAFTWNYVLMQIEETRKKYSQVNKT